ncbi:MAG TPA: AIR carboxylase family protein, partial [Candidatus Sulfotelmatobacter sp.]|nr:AIR carboxylase family protein [Candidatus Sulfotelmatobacter sp.]
MSGTARGRPRVGIVVGSESDLGVMDACGRILDDYGVGWELGVISAHRAGDLVRRYGSTARERGLRVLVAGAGGAAHLPGVLASLTILPVIGVPLAGTPLHGMDSLLSIVQMPAGIPVATVAVGEAGARN